MHTGASEARYQGAYLVTVAGEGKIEEKRVRLALTKHALAQGGWSNGRQKEKISKL